MYEEKGKYFIDKTDQCSTCWFKQTCILMQLFGNGYAQFPEDIGYINITNCPFYRMVTLRNKEKKTAKVLEFKRKNK